MKILLTNDDGVYAEGLKSLYDVLKYKHELTVVAPLEERSTTGHTLTLDHPLRVVELGDQHYGCSGYPADCTLMGLGHLLKESKPDLVISGINRGANLGQDIYYSGTVAAAREAIFRGVPALAVSSVIDFPKDQYQKGFNFETAAVYISKLLDKEIHTLVSGMNLLNINVPNVKSSEIKGAEVTELGFRRYSEDIEQRKDFRNRPYYWIGGVYRGFEDTPGTDCHCVDQNKISVTCLNLLNRASDTTHKLKEFIKV